MSFKYHAPPTDPFVQAEKQLGQLAATDTDILLKRLASSDLIEVDHALMGLQGRDEPAVVDAMIAGTKHKIADVRFSALLSLSRTNWQAAVTASRELLADTDGEVKALAAQIIAEDTKG